MSNSEIRFVKSTAIDRRKWDHCIDHSISGIAYASSWYLDRICRHWDALIWGDYLYVMPLPNNSKFGISYIYQPFFTQQLGVFSAFQSDSEIVNQFLSSIPGKFRLTDLKLNISNWPTITDFSIAQNTTYQLSLQSGIENIRGLYQSNTRRNIQKAVTNHVYVSKVSDISFFRQFTQKNLRNLAPEIKSKHYAALHRIIEYALNKHLGEIYGAFDSTNNLIASAFFLNSHQKYIFLAASSNAEGIEQRAMFLLIDQFLSDKAGENQILDFEGSNIPGIARFYAGFGASPESYYSIHRNKLPKLLRLVKK